MARYDPNFTPVKDLRREMTAEAALEKRLARRKPSRQMIKGAGAGYAAIGNKAAAAHMQNKASRDFETRETDRLGKVKDRYYDEQSKAKQTAITQAGDIAKQAMSGQQQLGLAKFGAAQDQRLEQQRGRQRLGLAKFEAGERSRQAGLAPKKGGLSVKDRFGIRKGLLTEFNAETPAGEALRKKYGENGFGMFATQMEQRYQPQQQQPSLGTIPQPPTQVRAFQDPATGVWQGGQQRPGMTGNAQSGQPVILPSAGSAGSPGQLPIIQPAIQQQSGLGAYGQPVSGMAPQENMRLGAAFAPPQSLSEFNQSGVDQREAKIAEAFGRPLKKKTLPLPGKRLASSLRSNVLRERAARQGGGAYYNR